MEFKKEAISRRTFVTKGADPTEIVEWTVYATNGGPNGEVDKTSKLIITEFQGIYSGRLFRAELFSCPEIPESVARNIHCELEHAWGVEQEELEAERG